MIKTLLAMSTIFVALSALAAPVYKHVGPDGKVAYSDMPAPTGLTTVKGGIRSKPAGFEDDPVSAATVVATNEIVVDSVYAFCRDEMPDSAPTIMAARGSWKEQHATLIEKSRAILAEKLTIDERRSIAAMLKQENEKIAGQLRQAPYAERKKMCEGAPARFTTPEMNLAGHPALVRTIMDHTVRR